MQRILIVVFVVVSSVAAPVAGMAAGVEEAGEHRARAGTQVVFDDFVERMLGRFLGIADRMLTPAEEMAERMMREAVTLAARGEEVDEAVALVTAAQTTLQRARTMYADAATKIRSRELDSKIEAGIVASVVVLNAKTFAKDAYGLLRDASDALRAVQ